MNKELTFKQLKKLLNEANEAKTKYVIDYINCDSTVDDYKDGEDPSTTNHWDVDAPNIRFSSIEEALKYVCEKLLVFSWNKKNWFYFENGRFFSDFLVDESNSEVSITDSDIDSWKRGETTLWNCHVDVSLTKISESVVDETDAKAESFETD